jgi:hypothetical protein
VVALSFSLRVGGTVESLAVWRAARVAAAMRTNARGNIKAMATAEKSSAPELEPRRNLVAA